MKKSIKKVLAGVMLAMLFSLPAMCKDIIVTKDNRHITCIVKKITPTEIKYVEKAHNKKKVSWIMAFDVDYIIYKSGDKEIIKANEPTIALRGKYDAKKYYAGGRRAKSWRSARGWTCATTVACGGVVGLIPAIACSSTRPKTKNLNYPDEKLMQNQEYNHAYRREAKKIKSGKIWGGYVEGIVILLELGLDIAIIGSL